ncbi:hypothetical protein ACFW3D_01395 [Streptomyces sp. NPDC058864]
MRRPGRYGWTPSERPPRVHAGLRVGRYGPGCGCFSCLPLAGAALAAVWVLAARRAARGTRRCR